jgi:hypothetical protein
MPIIRKRKDLLTRFPLGLVAIFIFSILPILVAMIGANISEAMTGEPCHEGNCFWGGIGWLFLITMPVGFILLVGFIIKCIVDFTRIEK